MAIFDTEEWGKIVDTLNRRKEKIFKKILEKNPELNDMKYTERDMLITEYELIEIIIKKPKKLEVWQGPEDDET
jgi:hypothetical protein